MSGKTLTFRAPDGKTRIRPKGKNTAYSTELARIICEKLMNGQSLQQICKDPRMPSRHLIIRWLSFPERADFREMYLNARRIAAEILVDEIMEIADDTSEDFKPRYNKKGEVIEYIPDNEAIHRSNIRINARKWYAAKMIPRLYGDKVDVDLNATGDLAELLKKATNNDQGLPPPIDGEKTG